MKRIFLLLIIFSTINIAQIIGGAPKSVLGTSYTTKSFTLNENTTDSLLLNVSQGIRSITIDTATASGVTLQPNIEQLSSSNRWATNLGSWAVSNSMKAVWNADSSVTLDITPDKFYISTASSGNADAKSWANKQVYTSFTWSRVGKGDTVFVDGGADSLIYSSVLTPNTNGSYGKNIIIKRPSESGHNGIPVFANSSGYNLYLYQHNYITFENLKFKNASQHSIAFNDCDYIVLNNCTVIKNSKDLIVFQNCESPTVVYCTIETGNIDTTNETDGIALDGSNNATITYNRIILANQNGDGHNDIIHGTGSSENGLIHNNFFMQNTTANGGGLYLYNVKGNWNIYNNIIVSKTTYQNSMLEIGNYSDINLPLTVKINNNTFANDNNNYPIIVRYSDSTIINNNIIYKPSGTIGINLFGNTASGYVSIDYNRYYLNSTTENQGRIENNYYTWSQWTGLGYEAHGSTGQFYLNNFGGLKIEDYKTMPNIDGIYTGKDLGYAFNYFSNDIYDTLRPINSVWDVGAFENRLYSLLLDGSTEYAYKASPNNINTPNTAITIEGYFKTPSATTQEIIARTTGTGNSDHGWEVMITSSGSVVLVYHNGDGILHRRYSGSGKNNGQWHYYKAIINYADAQPLTLYVDGVSAPNSDNTTFTIENYNNTQNLTIGKLSYTNAYWFNGELGWLKISSSGGTSFFDWNFLEDKSSGNNTLIGINLSSTQDKKIYNGVYQ